VEGTMFVVAGILVIGIRRRKATLLVSCVIFAAVLGFMSCGGGGGGSSSVIQPPPPPPPPPTTGTATFHVKASMSPSYTKDFGTITVTVTR
jgi:hypothetical protein